MGRILKRVSLAARVLRYGDLGLQAETRFENLSPEDVREIKQFFPMDKFFIFGHARSGTTLLARLIRVHPNVHCNWQAHFFTRPPYLSSLVSDHAASEWLSRRNNRWNRGKDLSPWVLRAAADFILERDAVRVGKNIVGDKSPNNLVNGEAVTRMAAIYPDAKLIFIVRDGRDAVLSHQIQKFIDLKDQLSPQESTIRQAIIDDGQSYIKDKHSIFSKSGLSKAAQDWVDNVTETDQVGTGIYSENYMHVRFEDLVAEPRTTLQHIWSFLDAGIDLPGLDQALDQELAENPDADWQREKQRTVADIIRKGLPGSWRDIYTAEDVRIFKDIAGDTLIKWGYETDLDW